MQELTLYVNLRMFITIASLFINVVSSSHKEQLHDYMTKDEKQSIFLLKPEKVHTAQYQVVPVLKKYNNLNETRDPDFEKPSIYLKMFNEDFDLYLEENNNVLFGARTPIILPYMGPDGKIKYNKRKYNLIPALTMGAYHDRQKRAALTIDEDEDGRINVNGIINDTIIIRSIPKRLYEEVMNKNPNLLKASSNDEADDSHPHIVIRRDIQGKADHVSTTSPQSQSTTPAGSLIRHPRGLFNFPWSPLTTAPPFVKDFTVYPKILIVLDHESYLFFKENLYECIKHVIAYWNIVDLRFREMEKPRIRFNIAGVIIATEPNVAPYMENQKACPTSRYCEAAIFALKDYFTKENVTFIDYDIVVGMSPWRLVERTSWWRLIYEWITDNQWEITSHGIATYSTICRYPREAMALVRDGGDLYNANIATHEIAHILGVDHDPSYKLHEDDPDYKSHWDHGFLMSYTKDNKNQMHWSDFSIREMQKFLQKPQNNYCLLDKPLVNKPYRKILPGKLMDRDQQCKILLGRNSFSDKNKTSLRDCLHHHCFSKKRMAFKKISILVVEGSPCGDKKICIEGDCVKDYTDPKVYHKLSKAQNN